MINIDACIETVLKRPRPEWFSNTTYTTPDELRWLMKEAVLEYQRKVDERNQLTHMTQQQLDQIDKQQ